MEKRISRIVIVITSIVATSFFLLLGCGESGENKISKEDSALVSKRVADINQRIDEHNQEMMRDSSDEGRNMEMDDYKTDIETMTTELGGMMADMDECCGMTGGHMMGGGNMMGSDEANTYACENALSEVKGEFNRHHESMMTALENGDDIENEMSTHHQNIQVHMESMMHCMDQKFGTSMMEEYHK